MFSKIEQMHNEDTIKPDFYITQPTGISLYPVDLANSPRVLLEYFYNIQHFELFDKGGHFAALERPDSLASEIQKFAQLQAVIDSISSNHESKSSSTTKTDL